MVARLFFGKSVAMKGVNLMGAVVDSGKGEVQLLRCSNYISRLKIHTEGPRGNSKRQAIQFGNFISGLAVLWWIMMKVI